MDTITTLASPLAILALVNLAKRLGLTGSGKLALLAVALGVALALAEYFGAGNPAWIAARDGGILGLSAAGLFDAAQTVGGATAYRAEHSEDA